MHVLQRVLASRSCKEAIVELTAGTDFPGTWTAYDDSWDLEHWKHQFRLVMHRATPSRLEFDMIGVSATVANTLRRILIAEVPTMAFEEVYVRTNTGIMTDEILCHRLGLIPIRADPDKFEERLAGETPTDGNTIVFDLDVTCSVNPSVPATAPLSERHLNRIVTTEHLQWVPQGDQPDLFAMDPIRPVSKDIVITKLNPGESISLQLHAKKGTGRDHAKFSPVGTASYRILPEIHLLRDITGDAADRFAACFPAGVIAVERDAATGKRKAVVKDARKDTVSREVLRHQEFQDAVTLSRKRDHFIFQIETVGQVEAQLVLTSALKVLRAKAEALKACLNALNVD
ncbi:RNA polymerase 1-1, isoform CRA_b [Blastocladiella britannica]|nr:RNA polymerase 1-1, isoform CRA_b [Blastocladiella britannica]